MSLATINTKTVKAFDEITRRFGLDWFTICPVRDENHFLRQRQIMKIEIYEDKAKEWRWRFIATNGNIMADSGEGYKNLMDCEQAIERLKVDFPKAKIHRIFKK